MKRILDSIISSVAVGLLLGGVGCTFTRVKQQCPWQDHFQENASLLSEAKKWHTNGHHDLVIRFAPGLVKTPEGKAILLGAMQEADSPYAIQEILKYQAAISELPEGPGYLQEAAAAFLMMESPTLEVYQRLQQSKLFKRSQALLQAILQARQTAVYPAMPYADTLSKCETSSAWRLALKKEIDESIKKAPSTGQWFSRVDNLQAYQVAYPDAWKSHFTAQQATLQRRYSLLRLLPLLKAAYPDHWKTACGDWVLKTLESPVIRAEEKEEILNNIDLIQEALSPKNWSYFQVMLERHKIPETQCLTILARCPLLLPMASTCMWGEWAEQNLYALERNQAWLALAGALPSVQSVVKPSVWQKLHDKAADRLRALEAEKAIRDYSPQSFNVDAMAALITYHEGCRDYAIQHRAIQLINQLNDMHNLSDAVRFKPIAHLTSWQLYDLITEGAEEAYTSTYNGLFTHLLRAMEKEKIDGFTLFYQARNRHFRQMVSKAAQYNRLPALLSTMSAPHAEHLLDAFAGGLEQSPRVLEESVAVADALGILSDNALLDRLKGKILQEKNRLQDHWHPKGKMIYHLLASLAEPNGGAQGGGLSRRETLHQHEVEDAQGICVARFFFYDDEDGKTTQQAFLQTYQRSSHWKVESHENYFVARSTNKKCEIYANRYDRAEAGNYDITQRLGKRKVGIVVHRGHSYYTQFTLAKVSEQTRLVFLGSCGGYNHLTPIIHASPEAHIIATKGKGTTLINEPLIKDLFEQMAFGKTQIHWPTFWAMAENKYKNHGSDFYNYISPEKNFSAAFIRAYQNHWTHLEKREQLLKQAACGAGLASVLLLLLREYRKRLLKRAS